MEIHIQLSCVVLLLCVVSTNLTAAASVIDSDTVKCDQELCDAKTEYCDPLIELCTSCELPCSRTTVSETNLCKTFCAGYTLAPRSNKVIAAKPTRGTEEKETSHKGVLAGVVCVGLAGVVGLVVLAVVRVRRSRERNHTSLPRRLSPAPIYKGLSKIDTPGSSIATEEVDTAASHLSLMVAEEVDCAATCRPSIVADSGDADVDQGRG